MRLLDEIQRLVRAEVRKAVRRDPVGVVVTTDPLTIRLQGDLVDVEYDLVDDSLTLAEGDRVLLHRLGSRLLVAHKVSA